jgi:hypothetical protein
VTTTDGWAGLRRLPAFGLLGSINALTDSAEVPCGHPFRVEASAWPVLPAPLNLAVLMIARHPIKVALLAHTLFNAARRTFGPLGDVCRQARSLAP